MNITTEQPEAMRLADHFDYHGFFDSDMQAAAASELRRLHLEVEDYKVLHDSLMRQTCEHVGEIVGLKTRIEELEAQLYAVGAGGVGPLIPTTVQHQHKLSNDNDLQRENGHLITSSSTAPAGWKLVPVEPTMSMQHAALIESRAHGPVSTGECNALPISYELGASAMVYRAMLAAAPQPPVVEHPQGDQEPMAYYVERHAPGMRDHRTKLGPFWKRKSAEWWLDEHHKLHALYTNQRPPRPPLTDEQVNAGLIDSIDFADHRERCAFNIGVRFAERAHKICGEA